ncbi:MAG: hypothetical protein AAF985_08855 [Bacteroidota bacterium]
MTQSKLFELFAIIRGKRKKDLDTFASMSSNHLSDRDEVLMQHILKALKKNQMIDEEAFVAKYLKEEEKKNWNRIKNRMGKLLYKYFLMEIMEDQPMLELYLLTSFFYRQDLQKNCSSLMKKGLNLLEKGKNFDEKRSLYQYWLHELAVDKEKNVRKHSEQLQKMGAALDTYYFENKLRQLCEQINRKLIINAKEHCTPFITFLEQEAHPLQSLGVKIYYQVFKMLTTERVLYFNNIQSLLAANKAQLTQKYRKEIFDHLLNFCIRKINAGTIVYAVKYLKLIDDLIEQKLFLAHQKLSHLRYKNCITISLIANDIDWAETFSRQYREYLEADQKDLAVYFNQAHIAFYKKEYDQAHTLLLKAAPKDMYYKIAFDKLWLKLAYHQLQRGKFDRMMLKKRITSIRGMINKQEKLNDQRKSMTLFFLSCMQKLVNNKVVSTQKLLGKVPIVDYLWLKKLKQKGVASKK